MFTAIVGFATISRFTYPQNQWLFLPVLSLLLSLECIVLLCRQEFKGWIDIPCFTAPTMYHNHMMS